MGNTIQKLSKKGYNMHEQMGIAAERCNLQKRQKGRARNKKTEHWRLIPQLGYSAIRTQLRGELVNLKTSEQKLSKLKHKGEKKRENRESKSSGTILNGLTYIKLECQNKSQSKGKYL